ncbi:hairy-related 11 [Scomber japonicus]|uniref:hairy-related 11 n=1 Tax=Scomber japonicus TaxID=13676 RepID=UPI002305E6A2|nr:hairy-related 11 [Scomber japonicus]
MTRKIQNPVVDDTKSRKRILKPAVEKKRRDRINKSLAELRTMLLKYTADPRLQNPKIEKAEILDLVVDYLQKWTDGKNLSNESSPPSHLNIESAGFQQCVAQLASYMHKITPAQRTSLIEGLKHHNENQQPSNTSSGQDSSSSSVICTSESKEGSHRSLFLSHSPPQPQSCSTPCHDTLSPPASPWFSPSFSTYSPPFPSFACHFSFPSCLSPPSSNTSFSTLPQSLHTLPAPVVFSPTVTHFPSLTTLRPPPHPLPFALKKPVRVPLGLLMRRPLFFVREMRGQARHLELDSPHSPSACFDHSMKAEKVPHAREKEITSLE